MKKRIVFLLAALLAVVAVLPAFAAEKRQRVFDQAELLNAQECEQLEEKLEKTSDAMGMDLAILSTKSKEGKTLRAYADDFYDEEGLGAGEDKSGLLFLIDLEDRVFYITTAGEAVSYFDDDRIKELTDGNETLYACFEDGRYYDGIADVADQAVAYYQQGKPENAHIVEETAEKKRGLTLIEILIAVLLPGLAGLIYVQSTKKSYAMEAEKQNSGASLLSYQATSAFVYSLANDKLLEKKVTTRVMPVEGAEKNSQGQSTVHTAESGTVHGGGGGQHKF